MNKNYIESNSILDFKQHGLYYYYTLKENVAPWAAGATNDSAIMPAKEADTGICQSLTLYQPVILRDWKQL